MAIILTPRLGLATYGAGSDSPSREGFNTLIRAVDAKAAYDDGTVGTTLPPSGLVDGRYAETVNGSYRKLYRRAGGAWRQVGGNTWEETTYARADTGLPTSGAARIVSHPTLANPTAIEYWDGSSSRGGLQTISDLNSGQPGALHVGSTDPVSLTTRGRVYARTTATDQRAFVASAHSTTAGFLFSAIEQGGSVAWQVDARGQMRAQAPTAFGGGQLAAGVPLSAAPGASDTSAVDLYAASGGKYALRVFRTSGETIATFAQDNITLGRSAWSGGSVSVLGPRLDVAGALNVTGTATLGGLSVSGTLSLSGLDVGSGGLDVTGATALNGLTAGTTGLGATTVSSLTVSSGTSSLKATTATSLTVSGSSDLKALTATSVNVSSLTASGTVQGSTVQGSTVTATGSGGVTATGSGGLTATNGLSLHGSKVTSAASGSGAELRTQPPTQYSGTNQQSVRASVAYRRSTNPSLAIDTENQSDPVEYNQTVTMPEAGWMRLDLGLIFNADTGAPGAGLETFKTYTTVLLYQGSTLKATSLTYVSTVTSDSPERGKPGEALTHITEIFDPRLDAGAYTIRLRIYRKGTLAGRLFRAIYTVTPVVLYDLD